MCAKRYCLLYSLNTCERGRNALMHALSQCAASLFSTNGILRCRHMVTKSNRSVIWDFSNMICNRKGLKVVTVFMLMHDFLMTLVSVVVQPGNTLITVWKLSRFSIIQLYPSCSLHMIEILFNPVRMGSPRPWAGAKTFSKTLIVLGQSCKRIHGSEGGLEKSSSQVAHCDRCPLEDFSITPLPRNPHHPILSPSPPPSPIPPARPLSVLLSWERAARGDPRPA